MLCRLALPLCSAAVALTIGAGCARTSETGPSPAPYRTVSVQPRRDTAVAKRLNEVGRGHLAKEELDKAAAAFKKAVAADVEYGPAHNNLGKVYFRQKDWYRAAWEFEYAKKLLPRHPEPRHNLALVLQADGQFDRAIQEYREAVSLDGEEIRYRASLAGALILRGDRTAEVRALLEQILKQDTRPEWLMWAKRQLTLMGAGDERPGAPG